jgi:phosphatidate cytidylyltransferase
MKRVLTAAILIPLVLVILLRGSFLLLIAVTALVAGLAAWEYLAIADAHGAKTPRLLTLACIAALFAAAYWNPSALLPVIALSALVLLVVCSFRSPLKQVLPDTAFSAFAVLYCGLTLLTVPLLREQPDGPSQLVFLLCAVWMGDIVALYVGRNLGRRKLAPNLSPNKTWEGSAGSIGGSLIITVALFFFSRETGMLHFAGSLTQWLILAVVVNIAAQLGDLVESAIKRGAGVKDSGSLLPGHGGILDRIDALLLAAPALWYAQWIQHQFTPR